MKSINLLIVSLIFLSACKTPKYPDLEEGLYADIQTNIGDVVVELYYEKVPMTAANFVALSEGNHPEIEKYLTGIPFYKNLPFHRVIEDFMVQSGKMNSVQKEKIDYSFSDEFRSDLRHDTSGVLSMTNLGKPYSNSTRFFITRKKAPWLDGYDKSGVKKSCGKYGTTCNTVFGKVIKGKTVLDSIQLNDSIRKIEIIRVGRKAEGFNAPEIFSKEAKRTIPYSIKKGIDSAAVTNSGLKILKLKEGTGKKVNPALPTKVHYSLYTTEGKKISSSIDKGKPLVFTIHKDPLIAGWKEGASGMREGEKARLFIPSYLGYGSIGRAPLIEPNADLIFEIEILKVGK